MISNVLGKPTVNSNTRGTEYDRYWKTKYGLDTVIELTIHIYNKPKNKHGSKILIQGSIH